jgi:hypothetical protein
MEVGQGPKWGFSAKEKKKLSLYLIKHHSMKTYGEVKVSNHAILTSAVYGGEWLVSRSGRFTLGSKSPSYPLGRRPLSRYGRDGERKGPFRGAKLSD